jgi:acetyltransferase-like isoleucine patch superfamily enzyme
MRNHYLRLIDRIKRHLIQNIIFIPIGINLAKLNFLLREFFLGFENASNYLKSVSQSSVIPILKMKGAVVGDNTKVASGIVIHNCNKDFSNLQIGNNCYIGKECFFDLRNKISISNNVVIAMRCNFITHIDMSNSILSNIYSAKDAPILIEDNVYLGINVTVLMDVMIKEKSFIAANSLVKNSVDSKVMIAGIPGIKVKDLDGI